MRAVLFVFTPAAFLFAATPHSSAQVKAPQLQDVPPKRAPGLTFTATVAGKSDTRSARLVALYLPAGQPITPFLAAGPFTARWEGYISSPLRAEYTFAADVKGSFKVSINDKLLLEGAGDTTSQTVNKAFQLNKGENRFVAEFVSDGKLDALVRLNWWSNEFPLEPIPPAVFTHDVGPVPLRAGLNAREGRLLFAQLRCAACHAAPELLPPKGHGMPEMAHDAPLFDEIGAKFNEPWLAHWIHDPHRIRPGTLMPRVFHGAGDSVDQRAADLAAYFVSLGQRDDTAPAPENAPLGGALFASFGCIACHTTPDFQGRDEQGRLPLSHLKAKWQPRALREYLKNPARTYAWSRMPDFRLTEDEAERLTAYLLSGTQQEFAQGPKGDPAKGAQLLVSAGCLNCHAGMPPTTQPTLAQTVSGGWMKGCMAATPEARGNAPDFKFTDQERAALRTFAADGFTSLKQVTPLEFAERQFANVRCGACHSRDRELSTWSKVESEMIPLQAAAPTQPEAGAAPIPLVGAPIGTWFGEKLKPHWLEHAIAGTIPLKARPWLIARMPGFPTRAKLMAEGFAHAHGFPFTPEEEPAIDPQKVKAGEVLLGENGGFNCITCHAVGERPATAVFEAPGVDFAYSYARLRPGYYHRWVMHPLRIDPETKMPKFADDEGKTPLTDFFEGDARQQFDAMWHYLRTLDKTTAP